METIQDYDTYLTRMSKTFFDKAWFMSHLPEDVKYIIDFGCADGSFMQFLKVNCPSYVYIGIDNDSKFIELTEGKGFNCYKSIDELKRNTCIDENKTCFIFNSVIHEIWSYNKAETVIADLFKFNPKYIAIRDMMYNPIDRTRFYLPNKDYKKIIQIFKNKCGKQFEEFHAIWNKQDNETEITHFLLKYLYNNKNWRREVKENYLPVDITFLRNIFKENYRIDFQSFYKLPYLVNRWKNDFELDKNFELNEFVRNINTHYKMLLVREF